VLKLRSILSLHSKTMSSTEIEEVYLTSAPVIYQPVLTQNLDFALLYRGYEYQRHYISHVVDLRKQAIFLTASSPPQERISGKCSARSGHHCRSRSKERFLEGVNEFYPILLENKAKFGVTPTHTLEDLHLLHSLLPT